MIRLSHLAIALGSLLLSACANQSTTAPTTQQSWELQRPALEALDQWPVQGLKHRELMLPGLLRGGCGG